jgi:uncharacterized membrane protein
MAIKSVSLLWSSMGLVVVSSLLYHWSQKTIPAAASPLASLTVSYVVALVLSVGLFPFVGPHVPLAEALRALNASSVLLGVSIVGIELGFLLAYRSGWPINLASLTSSVVTIVLLVPIGMLIFHEGWSTRRTLGLLLCLAGLVLVGRP